MIRNELVNTQFGVQSFTIVEKVYHSLGLLDSVYRGLGAIEQVGADIDKVVEIESYLEDIHYIYRNLEQLLSLEEQIPYIRELEPRVVQVLESLSDIECRLMDNDIKYEEMMTVLDGYNSNLRELMFQYENNLRELYEGYLTKMSCTFEQYMEEGKCLIQETRDAVISVNSALPLINEALEWAGKQKARIAHLEASDAVLLAVYEGTREAKKLAVEAIKRSTKYGNDETINESRLAYTDDNSVPVENFLEECGCQ